MESERFWAPNFQTRVPADILEGTPIVRVPADILEGTPMNNFIKENFTFDDEEEGLKRYNLQTKVDIRDEDNKIQVLSVGTPGNRPTKCILLLGETGAGKTTIVNAMVNVMFGVKFYDDFRLQVKDQRVSSHRKATESQTDFITVYILYHQEGMMPEFNLIVIDTPGLADTRGVQQQKNVMVQLEMFLTSDYGIDDLNCIGLVAKANTNRDFIFQKDILREIMLVLGNNVPEITQLFATFAVEKPMVDQIVRNAGVEFNNMYEFDNGVLFAPHKLSLNVRKRDQDMLSYRWEAMIEQYESLFSALLNAVPVSVKLLREKKLLEKCMKRLKTQVENVGKLLTAMEMNKKMVIKYELQEAKNKGWRQERNVKKKNRLRIEEGFHAHNCPECNQTCIFPCPAEKEDGNAGFIGGIAGVLGGSAAGAAAAQATISSAAAAAKAAAPTGIATAVGGWVIRALGGTVASSELVATGSVPGIMVGGVVGITVGIITGTCCGRLLLQSSCLPPGRGDVCGEQGCLHSLSQHIKEQERIMEYSELEVTVNDDIKELFDVAVSKKTDAMAKIVNGKQKIQICKRQVVQNALELLYHTKKIQEISSPCDSVNPQDLFDKLISEVRLGHPDHIHHAVGILQILMKAVAKLSTCEADQVSDNCDMIMKLLENFPNEQ